MIEFIGFIITVLALIFLSVRQSGKTKAKNNGEEAESQEEFEELLRSMGLEVPRKKKEPPTPKIEKRRKFQQEPQVETQEVQEDLRAASFTGKKRRQKRRLGAVEYLPSLKKAIVLRELFGQPLALKRKERDF